MSRWLLHAALLGLLTGCASTPNLPPPAVGERPSIESDEAGLWAQMEAFEKRLQYAPDRVTDPALNAYVRDLTCKLAGEYCGDIRVYILRQPYFNAAMAPNGMLVIWTGLLLRAEDEAQLAFVLGHEIGHYVSRHSIERWRQMKSTANVATAISVLSAGAGAGLAGALATMGAYSSLYAFSREQEREADDYGLKRLRELGYDPRRAGQLWAAVWDEERQRERGLMSAIFATHPASEERRDRLLQAAADGEGQRGFENFQARVAALRPSWFEDELSRRHFRQSAVLFARLRALPPLAGEAAYYQGEMYRKRAGEGDVTRALEAYDAALAAGRAPPAVHRSRGLVLRQLGRAEAAREAFRRYLELAPEASDRAMIESYLQ